MASGRKAVPATSLVDITQAIYAPTGDPWRYPGKRPSQPYLLSGTAAIPLSWPHPGEEPASAVDGTPIAPLLAASGAVPWHERIPQIAYGANRDIQNLAWKLRHYAAADAAVSTDVVILPATVADADVVAANLGYWGYVYGSLLLHRPPQLNRPYLAGTWAPVTVLLLDTMQLACMHRSEGVLLPGAPKRPLVNCDVALLDVTLDNGLVLPAQYYAVSLPFLSWDGKLPVPLAAVRTHNRARHLSAQDQAQMMAMLVERLELAQTGETAAQRLKQTLRDYALAGTVDRLPQALYAGLRARIAADFALVDADGVVRRGNDDLPGLLSPRRAWQAHPTMVVTWG